MWCGSHEFPVSEHMVAGWRQADDVEAYVLADGHGVLGHGEVWLDAEEDEAELARIIVAPETVGPGRVLVRCLLARAVRAGFEDVFMRVHPAATGRSGVTWVPDSLRWTRPRRHLERRSARRPCLAPACPRRVAAPSPFTAMN